MGTLTQILTTLNDLARHFPWAALAASGVISPLGVAIKKWFDVQSERVMISIIVGMSAFAAAANYLIHVPTHDPLIIGLQTAVIGFMTQPVYYFVVKPALAAFRNQVEKASVFNAEIKSATVPATGLPISPTPDFSV